MLDKIWDDVLAGPHPERGLGKFRKNISTLKINGASSSTSRLF